MNTHSTDPAAMTQPRSGFFVTLEGLDGSGKTTVQKSLALWLKEQGYEVVTVNEPGGTPLGQAVREIFLSHFDAVVPQAEIGLLLSAKIQLLATQILPALAAGKVVLCDRYTDTLYAYQHYGRGLDRDLMECMEGIFGCGIHPDYTLYFDVSPETSMARGAKRRAQGGEYNALDAAGLQFRARVRHGFQVRLAHRPDASTFDYINAEQDPATVFSFARTFLSLKLSERSAVSGTVPTDEVQELPA